MTYYKSGKTGTWP